MHDHVLRYYCSLPATKIASYRVYYYSRSRAPAFTLTLQTFLPTNSPAIESRIQNHSPVNVRSKIYGMATIQLSFKPTIDKTEIFVDI